MYLIYSWSATQACRRQTNSAHARALASSYNFSRCVMTPCATSSPDAPAQHASKYTVSAARQRRQPVNNKPSRNAYAVHISVHECAAHDVLTPAPPPHKTAQRRTKRCSARRQVTSAHCMRRVPAPCADLCRPCPPRNSTSTVL